MGRRTAAAVVLVAAVLARANAQEVAVRPLPELDAARAAELQRDLVPPKDAPYLSIGWRIDLLAAQREAAAQKKPLFVWAMDGHPLGCT